MFIQWLTMSLHGLRGTAFIFCAHQLTIYYGTPVHIKIKKVKLCRYK